MVRRAQAQGERLYALAIAALHEGEAQTARKLLGPKAPKGNWRQQLAAARKYLAAEEPAERGGALAEIHLDRHFPFRDRYLQRAWRSARQPTGYQKDRPVALRADKLQDNARYTLVVPKSYDPLEPTPLVIGLHGGGRGRRRRQAGRRLRLAGDELLPVPVRTARLDLRVSHRAGGRLARQAQQRADRRAPRGALRALQHRREPHLPRRPLHGGRRHLVAGRAAPGDLGRHRAGGLVRCPRDREAHQDQDGLLRLPQRQRPAHRGHGRAAADEVAARQRRGLRLHRAAGARAQLPRRGGPRHLRFLRAAHAGPPRQAAGAARSRRSCASPRATRRSTCRRSRSRRPAGRSRCARS